MRTSWRARQRDRPLVGLRAALAGVLCGVLSCQVDMERGARRASLAAATQPGASTLPSAPLRWRGVPAARLEQVTLWVSQLLIRHRDAATADCAFIKTDWRLQKTKSERSRAEAEAIAGALARQARTAPDSFAALARASSEDRTSRERGGALGGIAASQFVFHPQILDALAALGPGETSDVVETECGYYVFQRHAPPAEQTVSGQHIVIGYDDAPWLRRVLARRGRELPHRSRERALEIALEVQKLAKQAPESFPSLVNQYSEHADASVGSEGDLGEWSTREATAFHLEVEALASVGVGEIADVVDTAVGYQIVRRTPLRPRKRYAMRLVKLWFASDGEAASASAKSTTEREAREVLAQLLAEPSAFERLQKEHTSRGDLQWIEGRGPAGVVPLLEAVAFQQVAPTLWESPNAFSVVQRLDPAVLPPPPALSFELPPRAANL